MNNKIQEVGLLLMRIALGLTFFIHGYVKFRDGIENVSGFFSSLGLPGFMAYVVAIVELVGGIAMILGLGTRIVGALFALVMLTAILTAKRSAGFVGGYEFEMMLLAGGVLMLLSSSRLYSLDSVFKR